MCFFDQFQSILTCFNIVLLFVPKRKRNSMLPSRSFDWGISGVKKVRSVSVSMNDARSLNVSSCRSGSWTTPLQLYLFRPRTVALPELSSCSLCPAVTPAALKKLQRYERGVRYYHFNFFAFKHLQGKMAGVSLSMTTTLGSFLSFQASCPYPTSTAKTFFCLSGKQHIGKSTC